MKTFKKMVNVFEKANAKFLERDKGLFANHVSERTLCGALMLCLHEMLLADEEFAGYYVDVEYNRNKGEIKTICRTIDDGSTQILSINCDLIVHSRGEIPRQDNLIAIEMKKSSAADSEKEKDRERLVALTKDTFDDVWAWNGSDLPEHVCRYMLGVYYEINYKRKPISLEYYRTGRLSDTRKINLHRLRQCGRLSNHFN